MKISEEYVIDFIKEVIMIYQNDLGQDYIDEVLSLLNIDEYEMAFEGLFIEIFKLNKSTHNLPKSVLLEIGLFLFLDKESVFDSDFWKNFITFLNTIQ